MKYLRTITVVAVLGLTVGAYAVVQNLHEPKANGSDVASMVGHLSQVFGEFAAFDLNKDGQLDAREKAALAKAIADGSLTLPSGMPPKDAFPSEEQRLNHMVEMYARFAVYDANHDGVLDSTEQAAVRRAFENGELGFTGANAAGGTQGLHKLAKWLHAH